MQNLKPNYAVGYDYRHNLKISVAVRWFLLASWFLQFNYRPDFTNTTYVPNTLAAFSLVILNAYIHWRIRKGLAVTWPWALGLSILDATAISLGMWFSGGFANNFFILYYPALAAFAIVFTSTRLSFAGVTAVALAYIVISLLVDEGVSWVAREEKLLFIRVATMYAVVWAVNLMSRQQLEREAERALQMERIRVSEEIHDGASQSGYAISLGLETCSNLAEARCPEVANRMKGVLSQVQQLLWELRYPINLGPVFEGRSLSRVLEDHIKSFSGLTSISTTFVANGTEIDQPASSKHKLFYFAHNAVTNAYRHAKASQVKVELSYEEDDMTLSVRDDGVGFDTERAQMGPGHGLSNMRRTAEELGGSLEIHSGAGTGTDVRLAVGYV